MNKPIIPKLEYDVVDHCNLGCRSCVHSSQLKPKGELDLGVIEEELKLLTDKFDVTKFCLKGGEPLIHPNIVSVILKIKRCLGDNTALSVATNGIKLPTMPEHFFLVLKQCNVSLVISEYGGVADYPTIYQNLKDRGITFSSERKVVFYDFLCPEGQEDPVESFRECQKREFYPLYRDKRFYLCCFVYDVPFVNNHFGYKVETNSVSINDSVDTILNYLSKHCSTCRFCSAYKKPHPWEPHKRYEQRKLLRKD